MSATDANRRSIARLPLGSCPDSWGVWFADDPLQTPWQRFLDELANVGYEWLELGPYGYLPTDPAQLSDELASRGLSVSGGTMHGHSGLHRAGDWPDILAATRRVAGLTAAVGAKHLIFVPVPGYRDDTTGAYLEPAELDDGAWRTLIRAVNELGKVVSGDYGLRLQFHPHADSHVETQEQIERFLTETDPRFVNLCLDTGHIAYADGDNVQIVERFPERINYVHLKQVDPAVRERVRQENLPLSEAVKLGAMVEPPYGKPDMPPLLDALAALNRDIYCVVEQDLYPVTPDIPLPIAARTAGYFAGCGLGPVRRWPYEGSQA